MKSKKISVIIAVAAIAFATLICIYSARMSEKNVAAFKTIGGEVEKTYADTFDSCPDCKDGEKDDCPDCKKGDHGFRRGERRVKKPHRHHRRPAPDRKPERRADAEKA